jgi:hypothetical protein
VNRPWLNAVAGLIVGVLLLLSGILMASTLLPRLDIVDFTGHLATGLVLLAIAAISVLRLLARREPQSGEPEPISRAPASADRSTWRMPPLTLLAPVRWSAGTKLGMVALRGYLVVSAILLVVKAIELGRT